MDNNKYSIILKKCGQQKLLAVKTLCDICGLNIKESKDVVEQVPSIIKSGLAHDEAMNLKSRIDGALSDFVVEMLPDDEAKATVNAVPHNSSHYDKGKTGCMLFLLIPLTMAATMFVYNIFSL